jgi:hypothetical protein
MLQTRIQRSRGGLACRQGSFGRRLEEGRGVGGGGSGDRQRCHAASPASSSLLVDDLLESIEGSDRGLRADKKERTLAVSAREAAAAPAGAERDRHHPTL